MTLRHFFQRAKTTFTPEQLQDLADSDDEQLVQELNEDPAQHKIDGRRAPEFILYPLWAKQSSPESQIYTCRIHGVLLRRSGLSRALLEKAVSTGLGDIFDHKNSIDAAGLSKEEKQEQKAEHKLVEEEDRARAYDRLTWFLGHAVKGATLQKLVLSFPDGSTKEVDITGEMTDENGHLDVETDIHFPDCVVNGMNLNYEIHAQIPQRKQSRLLSGLKSLHHAATAPVEAEHAVTESTKDVDLNEPAKAVTESADIPATMETTDVDNSHVVIGKGRMHVVGASGFHIISDVDDTVKDTRVLEPMEVLKRAFVKQYSSIKDMNTLYTALVSKHAKAEGPDFAVQFLSASPYAILPSLDAYLVNDSFPSPMVQAADFSFRDLKSLKPDLRAYKRDGSERIIQEMPNRRFLLFGDSGQMDPEAYGDVVRAAQAKSADPSKWPEQFVGIFIRQVNGPLPILSEQLNTAKRFQAAFQGLDPNRWRVFGDPMELADLDIAHGQVWKEGEVNAYAEVDVKKEEEQKATEKAEEHENHNGKMSFLHGHTKEVETNDGDRVEYNSVLPQEPGTEELTKSQAAEETELQSTEKPVDIAASPVNAAKEDATITPISTIHAAQGEVAAEISSNATPNKAQGADTTTADEVASKVIENKPSASEDKVDGVIPQPLESTAPNVSPVPQATDATATMSSEPVAQTDQQALNSSPVEQETKVDEPAPKGVESKVSDSSVTQPTSVTAAPEQQTSNSSPVKQEMKVDEPAPKDVESKVSDSSVTQPTSVTAAPEQQASNSSPVEQETKVDEPAPKGVQSTAQNAPSNSQAADIATVSEPSTQVEQQGANLSVESAKSENPPTEAIDAKAAAPTVSDSATSSTAAAVAAAVTTIAAHSNNETVTKAAEHIANVARELPSDETATQVMEAAKDASGGMFSKLKSFFGSK